MSKAGTGTAMFSMGEILTFFFFFFFFHFNALFIFIFIFIQFHSFVIFLFSFLTIDRGISIPYKYCIYDVSNHKLFYE